MHALLIQNISHCSFSHKRFIFHQKPYQMRQCYSLDTHFCRLCVSLQPVRLEQQRGGGKTIIRLLVHFSLHQCLVTNFTAKKLCISVISSFATVAPQGPLKLPGTNSAWEPSDCSKTLGCKNTFPANLTLLLKHPYGFPSLLRHSRIGNLKEEKSRVWEQRGRVWKGWTYQIHTPHPQFLF